MSLWTISIDTPPGITEDPDVLVAFDAALHDEQFVHGPSASLDTEERSLGATFNVYGDSVQEAVDVAVESFNRALAKVGLPHGSVVHIDAEPTEERELEPA